MFNNRKMGSSDSLLDTIKGIMEKKHTTPETPKEKALAKLAHPKDKITHKDVLVGRGVLKKENSGDRMGVIVATRKEKVELEPKLKESEQFDENMSPEHKKLARDVHNQLKRDDSMSQGAGLTLKSNHKMLKAKYGSDWRKKAGIKEEVDQVDERELTAAEKAKKEKYVMSLKGKMGGFKKRYGERAKEVMYATATKMAKEDVQPVNELEKSKYVDKVRDATDPSYGRGADHIIKKAGKEHGAKFAKDLEGIAYKSHFPRHKMQKSDPLKPLPGTSAPRVTKAGKMHSVDAKTMRDKIRARLGKHRKPNLPESSED